MKSHEHPDDRASPPRRPTPADMVGIKTAILSRWLPAELASDVLASIDATAIQGITLNHPITLVSGSPPVERETLFAAFREALAGNPSDRLPTRNKEHLDAKITVDLSSGVGQISLGKQRLNFANVDLLATDEQTRAAALKRVVGSYTLTASEMGSLQTRFAQGPLDDTEFTKVAGMLDGTPEAFSAALRSELRMEKDTISVSDLLPEMSDYWDRLVPPPPESVTNLAAYIEGPLRARRQVWLKSDPAFALQRISMEFAAPALIPFELLDEVSSTLPELLRPLTNLNDHFGLVGTFEICARYQATSPELVNVGLAVLSNLGAPGAELDARVSLYAAMFILASARLARHEKFSSRPAFWRRLAASTHAALVVRTLGLGCFDATSFRDWAVNIAGTPFVVSALLDRQTAPRWRPEWLSNKYLVGDAVGRLRLAWYSITEETRPAEWHQGIEGLNLWHQEKGNSLLAALPAMLEGDMQCLPLETLHPDLRQVIEKFVAEPGIERIPVLAGIAFTHCLPRDVNTVLRSLLKNAAMAEAEDSTRELGFLLASHLSVATQDGGLADIVAETAIQTLEGEEDWIRRERAIRDIIECTGAYSEEEGEERLVSRLEHLAISSRNEDVLAALGPILVTLKRIRPRLRTRLGRSLAAVQAAGMVPR